MFGYGSLELEGRSVHELIPEQARSKHRRHVEGFMKCPHTIGKDNRDGVTGLKKNGETIMVEIRISPLTMRGEPFGVAIVRDLSERRYFWRLERMNRELEQFTYIISHDLQEPLRNLLSYTHYLGGLDKERLSPEVEQCLKFIEKSSTRMSQLVKALLDYSLIGRDSRKEEVSLNTLVRQVVSEMKDEIREKNALIEVRPLPNVAAVESEMRQLFRNMISNAIKFQRDGHPPEVVIDCVENPQYFDIRIRDNGIGIAEENSEAIFRIFQRLHSLDQYQGTGIGLAHSRKIVETHGGNITVESELDKGSTFHLELLKTE